MRFFASRSTPSMASIDKASTHRSQARSPPRPPVENVLQLLERLQHVQGDLIRIYTSDDLVEPIFVQEGLLRLVFRGSFWFERTMRQMEFEGTDRLVLHTQEDILALFVFWAFHTRVPGLHEFGKYHSIPSQDDEDDYQTLLVRTWVFADSVDLPAFQNALMVKLFDALDNPAKDLTAETLQICLLVSESATRMRWALVQYMLWWEDQSTRGMNDYEPTPHPRLQPYINIEEVKGIEADLHAAREVRSGMNNQERKKRPIAGLFFVCDPCAKSCWQ